MHPSDRPKFTYLGHSSVLSTLADGRTLLIDPWVRNNPSCPENLKKLDRVDAILITHGHSDHIGDALEIIKEHRPEIIVATFEVCGWLSSKGVKNCSPMNVGGSQQVLGLKVTQVQAFHTSSIEDEGQMIYGGVATGYVVAQSDGWTFYHAGDTALFSDMQLVADLYRPQLAFLPIGDLFTMDPRQAALACKYLEVREVVPIHWGTFPELTGTPADLERELSDEGINCKVVGLQPGDTY